MAEQLYLAVELRCDLNHIQFGTPGEGSRAAILKMENKEAEQCLRKSVVRNNCEKGAVRFNNNFEIWIIGEEKHMLKLKFRHSLHLFLVSSRFFVFCFVQKICFRNAVNYTLP